MDAAPIPRAFPGSGMLHPLVLGAVALLILNDHWFKAAWPSWWTGKLSDVAGLAMFPLLLQALWEQVATRRDAAFHPSRRVLGVCVVLTALCFAAIKLFPLAAMGWRWGLGALQWPFRGLWALLSGRSLPGVSPVRHTMDVTDLLTLPAVLVSLGLGWRRGKATP
ncbi:hypothetical protein [Melittangium boletus]|uniref:hypothetical protein n=1 Tax=Melittangium boletus TaxID=83453 RepID=UPI003DA1CB47